MPPRVTKAEIAREAGVSRTAVSLVLNRRPHELSEATVRLIERTARRLGFAGASPAVVRCVALITEREEFLEAKDDFYESMVAAAWDQLEELDYNVMTAFVRPRDGGGLRSPRVLRDGGLGGYLVLAASVPVYRLVSRRMRALRAKSVYGEWIFSGTEDSGWVASDDRAGCRDAALRVAELGHTRVALLGAGHTRHPMAKEREAGFIEGIEAAGLRVPPRWHLQGDWTINTGRRLMRRILDARGAPPTAVLCANDWIALGAMEVARERGVAVPRDVSFVGVDDCPAVAMASQPKLSTVAVDSAEVGRAAARELISWIDGPREAAPGELLPTAYVERESVGPARRY